MSSLIATADHPDKVKKWLVCLGCGKQMWTDRCHRICKKCRRRNNASPTRHSHKTSLPGAAAVERVATTSFLD
ncbi:hypothetical protein HQ576_09875 [bacterium]|nr:hypothetical protein [bacterium]